MAMTTPQHLSDRYEVGEILGFGGMSEVHLARDLRLGRDVAIKVLRADLARDPSFQTRFRREAQNAASLNHPAIVAVYDTGEEHGPSGEELPYIVMEFVNGRTLKEVLTAEGRLMPRRALEITADICAAISSARRGMSRPSAVRTSLRVRPLTNSMTMYGNSSPLGPCSSPVSYTATIAGWLSDAAFCASRRNRSWKVSSRARSLRSVLIATSR